MLGPEKGGTLLSEEALQLRDVKESLKSNTKLRLVVMAIFVVGLVFFKYPLKGNFNLLMAELFLLGMIAYTLLSVLAIRLFRLHSAKSITTFYFWWQFFDFGWMAAIFYYMGAASWISVIAFTYYLTFCYFTFSARRALLIVLEICLVFTAIVLLQFWDIIPFHPVYSLNDQLHRNANYAATTIITAVLLLYFAAQWNYAMAEKRNKIRRELKRMRAHTAETEEEKASCQVQIRARTKELVELASRLEEKAAKRTEELQQRVDELERFRKLTVGRELKMMELKKALKEARSRIKELMGGQAKSPRQSEKTLKREVKGRG